MLMVWRIAQFKGLEGMVLEVWLKLLLLGQTLGCLDRRDESAQFWKG
jgi:hypothetical protein